MDVRKIRRIAIGAAIVLVIVILVAVLGMVLDEPRLRIVNIDQVETGLTDGQVKELEEGLWRGLQSIYEYGDDMTGVEVSLRPESFEKVEEDKVKQYRFLIDIDEMKATYEVSFGLIGDESLYEMPTLGCPKQEVMKYPGVQKCDRVEAVSGEGPVIVEFAMCGEPASRINCEAVRVEIGKTEGCAGECVVIKGRAKELTDKVLTEVRERLNEEGYELSDYEYIYRQDVER